MTPRSRAVRKAMIPLRRKHRYPLLLRQIRQKNKKIRYRMTKSRVSFAAHPGFLNGKQRKSVIDYKGIQM
jgi:hypothetical protein